MLKYAVNLIHECFTAPVLMTHDSHGCRICTPVVSDKLKLTVDEPQFLQIMIFMTCSHVIFYPEGKMELNVDNYHFKST